MLLLILWEECDDAHVKMNLTCKDSIESLCVWTHACGCFDLSTRATPWKYLVIASWKYWPVRETYLCCLIWAWMHPKNRFYVQLRCALSIRLDLGITQSVGDLKLSREIQRPGMLLEELTIGGQPNTRSWSQTSDCKLWKERQIHNINIQLSSSTTLRHDDKLFTSSNVLISPTGRVQSYILPFKE